jgi:SAM-dependent methyltransferase
MSNDATYLMENPEESYRLDNKTDVKLVQKQALWAGIKKGFSVADVGCGPGKTTSILHQLVQPEGSVIGVDISEERIQFAKENYQQDGIEFFIQDLRNPLENLGKFDFIWIRFVLEYYRNESFSIVEKLTESLTPGGILCLIDLDYNCLNHFDMPAKLEDTIKSIISDLQNKANFDPFVGRKLYSFLYDLGFQNINVNVAGHHVIFGTLKEVDEFNWMKKIHTAPEKIQYDFSDYEGGEKQFFKDFLTFFSNPRRFTYSPIICCRGEKGSEK